MVTQIIFVLQECQNHSCILVLIKVFLGQKHTSLSCEREGALLYIFINIKRSGSLILSKYDTNSSPLCACNSGSEF